MEYENHLYKILYPNNALVASQLTPGLFANHYTTGSDKYYNGKVIFAELDPSFRNPFLPIDDALIHVHPHRDGRPKATKFIANYRVLEHIDFNAIDKLYLCTAQGYLLPLQSKEYDSLEEKGHIRIYAEISPMRMLILSDLDFAHFGKFITDPADFKSAPAQFYTQMNVDVGDFLKFLHKNPFTNSPITSIHPSCLRDAFHDLKKYKDKHNKGLCLNSTVSTISYKLIRRGYMFASQKQMKFFQMPDLDYIEHNHYKFFRNM